MFSLRWGVRVVTSNLRLKLFYRKMVSSSGFGNNESNNEEQPFVVVEHDTPPNMDARMMMLMEQMAKTNENIATIMARQEPGQPNTGTQVIFQSKEDPNTLYEKFRKRGATKFYGNEDAIKIDGWPKHIGDVFKTVVCDNKQRVVLTTSMLLGTTNTWWKSVRNSFKVMPNTNIWETFKKTIP